jgi:hypothetical protein
LVISTGRPSSSTTKSPLKLGANTNSMYDVSEKAYDPLVTAMSSQTLVQVTKDV